MALTWVPKGILEKIKRICFNFLWRSKQDKRVCPWALLECIALPKALGGWGLKNIYNFSKALVEKVGWRLINTTSLWTKVVWQKYIAPLSVIYWIQDLVRQGAGISVVWKVVLNSLDVI